MDKISKEIFKLQTDAAELLSIQLEEEMVEKEKNEAWFKDEDTRARGDTRPPSVPLERKREFRDNTNLRRQMIDDKASPSDMES